MQVKDNYVYGLIHFTKLKAAIRRRKNQNRLNHEVNFLAMNIFKKYILK